MKPVLLLTLSFLNLNQGIAQDCFTVGPSSIEDMPTDSGTNLCGERVYYNRQTLELISTYSDVLTAPAVCAAIYSFSPLGSAVSVGCNVLATLSTAFGGLFHHELSMRQITRKALLTTTLLVGTVASVYQLTSQDTSGIFIPAVNQTNTQNFESDPNRTVAYYINAGSALMSGCIAITHVFPSLPTCSSKRRSYIPLK